MKKFIIFVLIILLTISFSACTKSQNEVDDYAYVIAIGIDKGEKENLKVTLSFANPNKISGGGGESGGGGSSGGEENLINFTTETSGIFNSLNVANDNISKIVNLSHVKLVVFSQDIAKQGIGKYVDGLIRDLRVRPVTIVAVSESSPESYLRKISPKLEVNPEKYINDLFKKDRTTFLSETTLRDFFSWSGSDSKDIVMSYLGSQGEERSDEYSEGQKSMSYNVDDNETSEYPKKAENKSIVLGNVFFKGDKMVGTGSNIENLYNLILNGKASEVSYSIEDENKSLTELSISQPTKPKIKVDTSKKVPKLNVYLEIEANIMSMENEDVKKNEYEKIQKLLEKDLEKNIEKYLHKTVKDLKVDPIGFGNAAKKNFLTWKKWEQYDWENKYPSMKYDVKVNCQIVRFGLLDKSLKLDMR